MKNKHLLLLMLVTLALGLLVRGLPFPGKKEVVRDLFRIDTSRVTRLTVLLPDQPEMNFERTDAGWTATQLVRSLPVAPRRMQQMLGLLSAPHSLRIVKLSPAEQQAAGLGPDRAIQVDVYAGAGRIERFWLGHETPEAATFVRLDQHNGLYSLDGAFRSAFDISLDALRNAPAFRTPQTLPDRIAFSGRDAVPLSFALDTASGRWTAPHRSVDADSVRRWLGYLDRLANTRYADFFDDSRSAEAFWAQITLETTDPAAQPLVLKFYRFLPPEAPEEIELLRASRQKLAEYVMTSSDAPGSYFALDDSLTVHRVFALFQAPSR